MHVCHNCNTEITTVKILSRSDTCPNCDSDLRCCLNCTFYDTFSYNECKENQAERITEKDKANFCDFFKFRKSDNATSKSRPQMPKKENPLDQLFKK